MRDKLAIFSLIVAATSFSPMCNADSYGNPPGGDATNFTSPYGGIRGADQNPTYPNGATQDSGLRAPMNGDPNQSSAIPANESNSKPRKVKKSKSAPGPAVGMPDRVAKTGLGMTDRTAKTGLGMTDRTAKTGVGMTDRAVKATVGAPLKAVKETFKAIF